jgi:hypothetical protein
MIMMVMREVLYEFSRQSIRTLGGWRIGRLRSESHPIPEPVARPASRPTSERLEARVVLAGETEVTGLFVMDAHRDVDLFPLADGAQLDVARLPPITVRADAGAAVTQVRFGVNAEENYATDSRPFSIAYERGSDFKPWRTPVGTYTVTATPLYPSEGLTVAGTPVTVTFELYSTAPTKLVANPLSYGLMALTWKDNSTDETGFTVERSTDGVNFAPVASLGPNAAAYADTGVSADVGYYYRVAATAAGMSLYSPITWTMISAAAPAAPANMRATTAS